MQEKNNSSTQANHFKNAAQKHNLLTPLTLANQVEYSAMAN